MCLRLFGRAFIRWSDAAQRMSVPVAKEADEGRAARSSAPNDASADQQAGELTLHVRTLVFAIVLVDVVVVVFALAPVFQQLGDERATHAATAKDTAGNQQAHELAVPIAARLPEVLIIFVQVVVVVVILVGFAA